MQKTYPFEATWERMIRAVERVHERLDKTVAALESAGLPYAVAGGNAVANWVSRKDPNAIRNTSDVDILVRRSDLEAIKAAMTGAGFEYAEVMGVHLFIDNLEEKPSEGVHLLFAREKVRPEYHDPSPDVTESERSKAFQVVSLEGLIRMKLNSYRRKDQVHIQDMIRVGLIDSTWKSRFAPALGERLQELLDDPDG